MTSKINNRHKLKEQPTYLHILRRTMYILRLGYLYI